MGKKKKMSIVVTIITLILIITISTTALWKWTSGNSNVGFTISGLDAYIIYNKGSDVLTGVLDPVSSYSDSSVSTEITLYKNTNKTLYGHIYLDVTAIGTNIANESAVKWVITSNGQVLNEGNFVGSSVDTSIPLKINIPLSTTEQKFQIYIWLDEGMDINDAIEGETLSTIVRAEASEVEYEGPAEQTLVRLGISNINTLTPDFSKVPYITKEQAESDMTTYCELVWSKDLKTCLELWYNVSSFDELFATGYVSQVDDNGIFEAQDDLGTSYYYRGNVENNYVYFAGAYWRIIRINGDGTIRIIYDGPTKKHNGVYGTDNIVFYSAYNTDSDDNAYVGYMYGNPNSNYTNTHKNTTSSTIKTNLDKWYEDNIKASGNDKYVTDAIYCNDRKVVTGNFLYEEYAGDGTGKTVTLYGAGKRYYDATPSLICEQNYDKFSKTSIGNGNLQSPIGLITADELIMGGQSISFENAYPSGYSYLTMGDWYWTMSPVVFNWDNALIFDAYYGGMSFTYVNGEGVGASVGGVRPVVSLKSDTPFSSGDGSYEQPFVVG